MEVSSSRIFVHDMSMAWNNFLTSFRRWLFIIEGAGTMVAGVLAVLLLPDFPRSGQRKWLSEQEQRFAEWRLAQAANNEVDENGSIKEALADAFTDPKAWALIMIQVCQLTSQTWTYFSPISGKLRLFFFTETVSNDNFKNSPSFRLSGSTTP